MPPCDSYNYRLLRTMSHKNLLDSPLPWLEKQRELVKLISTTCTVRIAAPSP